MLEVVNVVQGGSMGKPAMLLGPSSAAHGAEEIKYLQTFFNGLRLPLYAVVDAARDRRMLPLLSDSGCEHRILYGNQLASSMDGLGPYLIALAQGTPFLERLLSEGWGNSWGIFLSCRVDLEAVRRHLRRLLAAKLPDGRQVIFRFYDPRVLRDYLPICSHPEIGKFFGPIHAIHCESPTGQELHSFTLASQSSCESPLAPQLLQYRHKLG